MPISEYQCPKCGGELSDCWDGEAVSAFVGEFSDDRFRCEGKPTASQDPNFGAYHWKNRTPSCGYLGLEDLGVKIDEE